MSFRKPFLDLTWHGKAKRLRESMEISASSSTFVEGNNCTSLNAEVSNTATELPADSCLTHQHKDSLHEVFNDLSDDDNYGSDDDETLLSHFGTASTESRGTLSDSLRDWALRFHITNIALSALLVILRTHLCFATLPLDSRTLLNTPSVVTTEAVPPGLYSHIGISTGLQRILTKLKETVYTIELLIGTDELPLLKAALVS